MLKVVVFALFMFLSIHCFSQSSNHTLNTVTATSQVFIRIPSFATITLKTTSSSLVPVIDNKKMDVERSGTLEIISPKHWVTNVNIIPNVLLAGISAANKKSTMANDTRANGQSMDVIYTASQD